MSVLLAAAALLPLVVPRPPAGAGEAQAKRIDAQVSHLRRVERDAAEPSTEGGTVTGWFRGHVPVKIRRTLYGETARQTDEFYLQNGQVFFVRRKAVAYAAGLNAGTADRVTESRFTFSQGRLVSWQRGKSTLVLSGQSLQQGQELKTQAAEYSRLLGAALQKKP